MSMQDGIKTTSSTISVETKGKQIVLRMIAVFQFTDRLNKSCQATFAKSMPAHIFEKMVIDDVLWEQSQTKAEGWDMTSCQ